jgi:hypothetical protein
LRKSESFEVDTKVLEKYVAPIFREYVGETLMSTPMAARCQNPEE